MTALNHERVSQPVCRSRQAAVGGPCFEDHESGARVDASKLEMRIPGERCVEILTAPVYCLGPVWAGGDILGTVRPTKRVRRKGGRITRWNVGNQRARVPAPLGH